MLLYPVAEVEETGPFGNRLSTSDGVDTLEEVIEQFKTWEKSGYHIVTAWAQADDGKIFLFRNMTGWRLAQVVLP